jgi:hypothetical protein
MYSGSHWSFAILIGRPESDESFYFKRQVLYIDDSPPDPFACLVFYGWNFAALSDQTGIEGCAYVHKSGLIELEDFFAINE